MINQHSEIGEVRGRFQLKMCEQEIRTERIKECVSCGCVCERESRSVRSFLLSYNAGAGMTE